MWKDLADLLFQAYEQFSVLPLFIEIALTFIVIAVFATISAYCSILYKRYKAASYERKAAQVRPKIEDLITEQVLLNPNLGKDLPVEDIQFDADAIGEKIYKNPFVRQILIDTIIQYRKNFRGEVGDLLRKLYLDMELLKDSFTKMKTIHWEKKIKGLFELTQMDVSISDATILPLTNSSNPSLRAAARNAYIQLSKNEPFKFFDIATEPMLPWYQLEMFKIITTTKDIAIPNFSRWVSYSSNKSIVSFCLKLIAHYDQQSAIPAVMDLLSNRDHVTRAEAINCLGKLSAEVAEEKMVRMYDNQPVDCQLEILAAIGKISSGKQLEFLKSEFMHSSNFDIRMNAARAIIRHNNQNSHNMVEDLMTTTDDENQLILKHCLNPLIK